MNSEAHAAGDGMPLPTAVAPAPAAGPDRPNDMALVERRAWIRYASDVDVSCQPRGAMKDAGWPGKIVNVSAGGIALLLRHRFERGTPLVVEVISAAESLPRKVRARVVHARSVLVGGQHGWLLGCVLTTPLSEAEVRSLASQEFGGG